MLGNPEIEGMVDTHNCKERIQHTCYHRHWNKPYFFRARYKVSCHLRRRHDSNGCHILNMERTEEKCSDQLSGVSGWYVSYGTIDLQEIAKTAITNL